MSTKLANLRKSLEKKDKFNLGLSPVKDWINVGNAGMNNMISEDMRYSIPVGRVSAFAGLQGTGKSFLMANIIKNAQEKGYFAVYVDTEYATGDGFMEKIGVDMSEDKFLAVNTSIIEEVVDFSSELLKNTDKDDKIIYIIDSLSNLQPEKDAEKFNDAKVAYGQGLREKMMKQLVTNLNSKCGDRNLAVIFTAHMYVNGMDAYGNPVLKPNVGEGTLYLPSVVVQLSKGILKDGKEISGIKVKGKILKSRFSKSGGTCEFELPWNAGMDFYDGAVDVLVDSGVVERNGAWYSFTDKETGETVKFQKKNFEEYADKLMEYYADRNGGITEKDETETNVKYVENKDA